MSYKLQRQANGYFKAWKILKNGFGINVSPNGQHQFFCVCHHDVDNKSATYYSSSDQVYCWATKKTLRPYDLLKLYGWSDAKIQSKLPEDYKPEKKKERAKVEDNVFKKVKRDFMQDNNLDKAIETVVMAIERSNCDE